jgi:hypothetical protein
MRRVRLVTRLTPDECVARLQPLVGRRSGFLSLAGRLGTHPVLGEVRASHLRLRKRLPYVNSWQTVLTARLRPHGGGTLISGKASVSPLVRALEIFWFGSVVAIGLFTLWISASPIVRRQPGGWWVVVFGPWVLLALGIGLAHYGRRLARGEARFLEQLLSETLEAGPVDATPARRPREG